jgi:hypothetical protein
MIEQTKKCFEVGWEIKSIDSQIRENAERDLLTALLEMEKGKKMNNCVYYWSICTALIPLSKGKFRKRDIVMKIIPHQPDLNLSSGY